MTKGETWFINRAAVRESLAGQSMKAKKEQRRLKCAFLKGLILPIYKALNDSPVKGYTHFQHLKHLYSPM